MSLTVEPDFQTFIDRFVLIHRANALLFPNSIGGNDQVNDLVNQIIPNELPIPQLTIEGPGPPHIFVTQSQTPVITEVQQGRNSSNIQGGKRMTLEFWNIILSSGTGRVEAEKQLYAIISALTTTLSKNKRMTQPADGLLPLAINHSYKVVPYIYDITNNETVAKNVVVRLDVGINLR